MVEPALYQVRPKPADQLGETPQGAQIGSLWRKREFIDANTSGPQGPSMEARRFEADDAMVDILFTGGRGQRRQHTLRSPDPESGNDMEDAQSRHGYGSQRRRHIWNISTVQSGYCKLRFPERCSRHAWPIISGRSNPSASSRRGSSRSAAQSRNGPRSQRSIGTPKPIFGRSTRTAGT